ncbi:MAG TPA: type VII secretion target [Pseudonocardiaceae bacterium]
MSQFDVKPEELREYAQYMRELSSSFSDITRFIQGQGCDTSGLLGLLSILTSPLTAIGGIVSGALGVGLDRLQGSADGLQRAADDYEETDRANAAVSDATIMPFIPESVGDN